MIRLAICGVEGPALHSLGSRLRDAVIDEPGTRDAAVVLDSAPDAVLTAEMFLRAGKAVLLSAAACPSLESLDRLIAASDNGATLAVLNGDRYLPSRRVVKEQLDAGKLGAVGLIRIHRWMASEKGNSCGTSRPWMLDLDLARWFVGALPDRVYAAGSENLSSIQIHLGFPGGAMALIDYASNPLTAHGYQSLAVIGASGAAHADDHPNTQLHFPGHSPRAVMAQEGLQRNAAMVQEFVDGLTVGRDFSLTLAAWRQTLFVGEFVPQALTRRQAAEIGGF